MIKNIFMYIIVIAVAAAAIWLFVKKNNDVSSIGQATLSDTPDPTALLTTTPSTSPESKITTTKTGLQVQDLVIGTGAQAISGKAVAVQYTGWLTNGTKFDSSYDHGQPFQFQLGAGQVIKGWDEGIQGMKVGGKRKLIIPSVLAYGNQAVGNVIPANATLVFEVELLGVPQ